MVIKRKIFNCDFDIVTLGEAAENIVRDAEQKKKFLVVTPNVDHLVMMRTDHEMRFIYNEAKYKFADGMPIVWGSRIFDGVNLPERVAGSDLIYKICELCVASNLKIYLLGGQDGVAEQAVRKLSALYPGLKVAGYYCPPFGFERDKRESALIVDRINLSKADILFIGVGAPKQEKWAYQYRGSLDVGPILGVGAAFDFVAGNKRRAPKIIQVIGFEWFWRWCQEPIRLSRRYFVRDLSFILIIIEEIFRK